MKTCKRCLKTKDHSQFTKDCDKKDGYATRCVSCRKLARTEQRSVTKISKALWEANNPEKMKIIVKSRYLKRRIKFGIGRNNKLSTDPFVKKQERLARNRYQEFWKRQFDTEFKIKKNLRIRLNKALRGNFKESSAWDNVGMSMYEFKKYMSTMFTGDMNWDNYGVVWEIDHIIPMTFFNLTDVKHVKIASHYSNLRPLTNFHNRSKGDKLTDVSALICVNYKLIKD